MKFIALLIVFSLIVLVVEAKAKTKTIKLDQLGKFQTINVEKIKPVKQPPKAKSAFSVSVTCNTESGKMLRKGDAGYNDCLRKKTSNFRSGTNNNSNKKSLNFTFGN